MLESTVVYSSLKPLRERELHGLCFHGANLAIEDGGYRSYGQTIPPGEDGCYIVAHNNGHEAVIGTDFGGYAKLFLYQSGERWACANSFIELVEFASRQGWPVTIDEPHLAWFFVPGSMGNQLASFSTSVKEIRLVPSTMEVTVHDGRVALRRTAAAVSMDNEASDYRGCLEEFLETWTGRMRAILSSDLNVTSDLTGGRDSRAVLALMLGAADAEAIGRVMFRSSDRQPEDLAVAQEIAAAYGLVLNDRTVLRHRHPSPTHAAPYRVWRRVNLGTYTPVYFPTAGRHPLQLNFGGSGGEGHRAFYREPSLEHMLKARAKRFPSPAMHRAFMDTALADMEELRVGYEANVDPLILHYRHFRDRMHGGRTPHYQYMSSPLASRLLRQASTACEEEARKDSQVIVDILLSLSPELATMRYDSESKAIQPRHRERFANPSWSAGTAGSVYFIPVQSEPAPRQRTRELHELAEAVSESIARVRGWFFPSEYLDRAMASAHEAARTGRFPHAVEGSPASHVLLAGELVRLSR